MERFMRQQMEAHERQFQAMLQAQERFMARQGFGFGGPGRGANNGDVDRAFQQLRREMEAFEREARARLDQPQGRPVPPPPDAADEPAEEQPKDPAGPRDADWPPRGAPRIVPFQMVDPRTGAEIRGFKMRWGVTEP
jgi:hypothetical protein